MQHLWTLLGAVVGAILSVPLFYTVAIGLRFLLFPGRQAEHAVATLGLFIYSVFLGGPLGAASGAAVVLIWHGYSRQAGWICLLVGCFEVVIILGLCLLETLDARSDERASSFDQISNFFSCVIRTLLPTNGGWLLWSLALGFVGLLLLRRAVP